MSAAFNQQGTQALMVSGLHQVGGGYTVQFKAYAPVDGVLPIGCEWSPTIPSDRDRRRKVDMCRYDHALSRFLKIIKEVLGDVRGAS